MNVLLINPPPQRIVERYDRSLYPHVGLAYIAANLKANNIDCILIDSKFEGLRYDDVLSALMDYKPDIVGLTAMTHEIENASNIALKIREKFPDCVIIIGGAHVIALPRETLSEFPVFDIGVIGEGEYTLVDIVNTIKSKGDLGNILGIVFRKNGEIVENKHRPFIENLDALPYPAWDLLPKARVYPLISSRGCPFQCIFCMRVLGNKVRYRSAKSIVNEMENLITKYQPDEILISDETFTANKSHVFEILDQMIEKDIHKKTTWSIQTRVDLVDKEVLIRMREAGCIRIGFGIESGNKEILAILKKGVMLDTAVNAVNMAKKSGYITESYFILGHPFETLQTANDTINFAVKLNTSTVSFGIMVPYPGTKVREMAIKGEGGYKLIAKKWSDYNKQLGNALELKNLSRKDLERLQLKGYITFYAYNLRILDLIKFVFNYRKAAYAFLNKYISH